MIQRITLILLASMLPGCLTLEVPTRHGAVRIGTDGEHIELGFSPVPSHE